MIDLTALEPGYRFPPQRLLLDRATVAAYVAAVEDHSPLYQGDEALVPPPAVLALAMRGLVEALARHPGTLHASQRLTAHRTVPVDTEVVAHLAVRKRSGRQGFAALTLELLATAGEASILEGAMLLFVPLARS